MSTASFRLSKWFPAWSQFGLAVMLLCLASTGEFFAQETAGVPQVSGEKLQANTSLVAIDIVVDDTQGKAIEGLTLPEVQVEEDGKSQHLLYLESHKRPMADSVVSPVARNVKDTHSFNDYPRRAGQSNPIVLVLDALDSPDLRAQLYLRQQLISYMKEVPRGTQMAIVQLDSAAHLLHGFTSSPEDLERAVAGPGSKVRISPVPDNPCSHAQRTYAANEQPLGIQSPFDGQSGAPCANSDMGEVYGRVVGDERSEILGRCLPEIMALANTVEGRKSIVWFYSQTPALEAYGSSMKASMAADEKALTSGLSKVMDAFKPTNISLIFVDTSPHFGLSQANALVAEMAQKNGGEAFSNTNGITDILRHVVDNSWNYYTAYYRPTDSNFDGHYRRITVQIDRPHGFLQYRKGYFAGPELGGPPERDGRRRLPFASESSGKSKTSPFEQAMILGNKSPNAILFEISVVSAPNSATQVSEVPPKIFIPDRYKRERKNLVQIQYMLDAKTIYFTETSPGNFAAHVSLAALAYDDRGSPVSSLRTDISVKADPTVLQELLRNGISVEQTVALPAKSSKFLRIGVEDKTTEKAGVIEVPVDTINASVRQVSTR